MAYIYIIIILLFRVVQAVFSKRASMEIKNIPTLIGYTSLSKLLSAVFALALIIALQNGFKADSVTVVTACFSGTMLFLSSMLSVYAMKSGTVSLNSMFGTAGMIIPITAGAMFFGKPLSLMQIVGMALFFLSAWLLIATSKDIYPHFSPKTVALLVGTLVTNGSTMLAQQLFMRYSDKGDVSVFSFISFASVALPGAALYSVLCRIPSHKKEKTEKLPQILIVCAVFLALALFVINQLATLSTALISPVILFTFINGGGTIISTVTAAVLYGERLTPRSVCGVIIGIVSMVIIKMWEI